MAVEQAFEGKKRDNMKKRFCFFIFNGLWLTAALSHPLVVRAANEAVKGASNTMEVLCLTEQPAIIMGESARLRAWASTPDGKPIEEPIKFDWRVTEGLIQGTGADVRWDLSAIKIESNELHKKLVATVNASGLGLGEVRCSVEVFIGRRSVEVFIGTREVANPESGSSDNRSGLISARLYLRPGETEELGYGLYSYLLFSAPPKNKEEETRYLKTIESLLALGDIEEFLKRHVRPSQLNATFIPVTKVPEPGKSYAESAVKVLSVYDYYTAKILLNQLDKTYQRGPYLISVLKPLSGTATPMHLFQNLTGVAPDLARNWIEFFTYRAAQERSWKEESLRRFGLTMRNLIAVGGKVTPDVLSGLEKMIQFKRGS